MSNSPSDGAVGSVRRFATAFAFGLLLAALAAAGTFRTQRQLLHAELQDAKAVISAERHAKEQAEQRATTAEATLRPWQARVALARAENEVRVRNFGSAEAELKAAAALLRSGCAAEGCVWTPLAQQLQDHRFSAVGEGEVALTEMSSLRAAFDSLLNR